MASKFDMAKSGASSFIGMFENNKTVIVLAVLAIVIVFLPLAIVPPDDNPDHAKDLDGAKKMLKTARTRRILIVSLSCIFVIVPLCIKGYLDFEGKGKTK